MIDSYGTSVLKKTQLMSSHLYKYLSGDCLILQAIETYPSIPRSWSLQCPLRLTLWHCERLLPLEKKKKKKAVFNVITSEGKHVVV